jgi:hypothetical protein
MQYSPCPSPLPIQIDVSCKSQRSLREMMSFEGGRYFLALVFCLRRSAQYRRIRSDTALR